MARLDKEMLRRGLAESRSRAQAMIAAGAVEVAGRAALKASQEVAADAMIRVTHDPVPFVSRGGLKLAHALDTFGIDPAGLAAVDLGASTGGFTDVLLQRGAGTVVAVDVGHGQFSAALGQEPRVTVFERLDVRALTAQMAGAPELLVADLSFISLTKALDAALALAAPGARAVVLVKPQFELEPGAIGKGGIVKDPAMWEQAIARVTGYFEAKSWRVLGVTDSPVAGGDGNREFLLAALKPPTAAP